MGLKRRMVQESLGGSGPPQRSGVLERQVPVEERALDVAHNAGRALYLLWKAASNAALTDDEEFALGGLLDKLYTDMEAIGAWKTGDPRVPVMGEPGLATVDWEG
jgi:hypothetical protein